MLAIIGEHVQVGLRVVNRADVPRTRYVVMRPAAVHGEKVGDNKREASHTPKTEPGRQVECRRSGEVLGGEVLCREERADHADNNRCGTRGPDCVPGERAQTAVLVSLRAPYEL